MKKRRRKHTIVWRQQKQWQNHKSLPPVRYRSFVSYVVLPYFRCVYQSYIPMWRYICFNVCLSTTICDAPRKKMCLSHYSTTNTLILAFLSLSRVSVYSCGCVCVCVWLFSVLVLTFHVVSRTCNCSPLMSMSKLDHSSKSHTRPTSLLSLLFIVFLRRHHCRGFSCVFFFHSLSLSPISFPMNICICVCVAFSHP